MTDTVTVPFGENASDNAVLLLAAAEELDLGAGVVKTSEGAFVVPQEVYDRAFGESEQEPEKDTEPEPEPEPEKPAKKSAAKKTAKKK